MVKTKYLLQTNQGLLYTINKGNLVRVESPLPDAFAEGVDNAQQLVRGFRGLGTFRILRQAQENFFFITFNITGLPHAAESVVILNGIEQSHTVARVTPGTYHYVVKSDNYDDVMGTIEITDESKTVDIHMEITTYELSLNVSPTVEYHAYLTQDDTTFTDFAELLPGNYTLTIEAEQYETYSTEITIDGDLQLDISLDPTTYSVNFNIHPYNVDYTLLVDDNPAFDLQNVSAGTYSYIITSPLYKTITSEFTVVNENVDITHHMELAEYKVTFEVEPDVEYEVIVIDHPDADLNAMPVGAYDFIVRAEGYVDYTGSFEVTEEDIVVEADLVAKLYRLYIDVTPSGDYTLTINGSTNFDLNNMPAGTHTIKVTLDGYQDYEEDIEITKDTTIAVDLIEET